MRADKNNYREMMVQKINNNGGEMMNIDENQISTIMFRKKLDFFF